jgi:hypothetical protein
MGDLLKGPLTGIIEAVGGIIGKFVASPEEKLKATQELMQIQLDFQTKVMGVDLEYAKAQASVINTEAGSSNWLASSWRPVLMLTFTYIIFHNYVLVTMFHLSSVPIPDPMWDLLKLGIGGYVMGRSVEKIAPSIAEAFSKK